MTEQSLAVIMTCHNRRDKTQACLESLLIRQNLPKGLYLKIYITDDGSTDGTAETIHNAYPEVHILSGSGSLFWNGGMRIALNEAMKHNHDFYLWLNDDTMLYPDALERLLETNISLTAQGSNHHIIAGSTRDAVKKTHTYGGLIRENRWHPFKFKLLTPGETIAKRCDTFNGNCVLIPKVVVEQVGNLDPSFTHSMADFDYALRATEKGCTIWIAPGFIGTCSKNSVIDSWQDNSLTISQRMEKFNQPKGLPLKEWAVFSKRHGGPLWLVYWLMPFTRMLLGPLRTFPQKKFF